MAEKKKRRVAGVVDRVEGDTIVVVVKDQDTPISTGKFTLKETAQRIELPKGDEVSVEMSQMTADSESKTLDKSSFSMV